MIGPRNDSRRRLGKVERVVQKYDLPRLGNELAERWTGEGSRQASLRELADEFNVRVLQAAMEEAGLSPLEGEARNMYDLLTRDDVSSGERTRAERQLERNELDVEELKSNFASHQAIHTYLTEHRGVERKSQSTDDPLERAKETVQRLTSRTQAVTENTCENLTDDGLTLGDFDVLVDVRIHCEDCGRTANVTDLIERGGCDCAADESSEAVG